MITLDEKKRARLNNALIVGMAPEAAYLYAGLTPTEIDAISEDDEEQSRIHQRSAELEHMLLSRMTDISLKQAVKGKETATTWLLEKLYPRYANKPQTEVGEIHLHMNDPDLEDMPTVEVIHDRV